MSKYIAVDKALQHILERIPRTATERVQLGDCGGRTLAEPVEAPWDSPRFDNSAMDGFAVRWEDIESVPASLHIAGESAAGDPADESLSSGEAIRISTGAAVPEGADTVVRRELCDTDDDSVIVNEQPKRGQGANIRRKGVYLQAGQPALEPGTALGGAEVGLLVSFGRAVVEVYTRPQVGIISTGDELVELGEKPGPGQIVNSNAYMLETLVADNGGVPTVFPTAGDDREAIERTYRRATRRCDLVVSTGGVSVGTHDHVGEVVDELAGGMTFWKVRMKPGKPLAFGTANDGARDVPLIGLPGNPGSAFVGFQLFVRPALAVSQGIDSAEALLPRMEATLRGSVRGSRGRRTYLAGELRSGGDTPEFIARRHQSSGNPALFAGIDALGIVERQTDRLEAGATISVHPLR